MLGEHSVEVSLNKYRIHKDSLCICIITYHRKEVQTDLRCTKDNAWVIIYVPKLCYIKQKHRFWKSLKKSYFTTSFGPLMQAKLNAVRLHSNVQIIESFHTFKSVFLSLKFTHGTFSEWFLNAVEIQAFSVKLFNPNFYNCIHFDCVGIAWPIIMACIHAGKDKCDE